MELEITMRNANIPVLEPGALDSNGMPGADRLRKLAVECETTISVYPHAINKTSKESR